MPSRVKSPLHLVGSLPVGSTDEALRQGAEEFGDLVFALPDGETGPRAMWVGYEHDRLLGENAAFESGDVIESDGQDWAGYRLREDVTEMHFDSWPRIDDALASYEQFRTLREKGVIPANLRFQVGLPMPLSALFSVHMGSEAGYPIVEHAFEDLVARELERLVATIPPSDLVIQWDAAFETTYVEGQEANAWEYFAGPVTRLTRLIPAETLVGYHLCYGTSPEWPAVEPRDTSVAVRMANFAAAESGRAVDFMHIAGPTHVRSEEESFFAPLADLDLRGGRLYLGIVLPIDGVDGLRLRHATASKFVDDFGVSMYCGFGRQPGRDGLETMREHRRVVKALQQPS